VLTSLKISRLIEGPLLTEKICSDDCGIFNMLRKMTIVFGHAMVGLAQPGSNGRGKSTNPHATLGVW
jgi:hypothetical protein